MIGEKGRNRALRALVLAATLPWAAGVYAAADEERRAESPRVSYASISDEDLTAIAARWDDLSVPERLALASEVTLRMKRNGSADGVLPVKVRRRFGTVVRHPNGATASMHVEVRSVDKVEKQGSQQFGVGFEQRARQDVAKPEQVEPDPPVLRVADPDE